MPSAIRSFTDPTSVSPQAVFVTGSEVERWGLGVVQEINSAAMHLFATVAAPGNLASTSRAH